MFFHELDFILLSPQACGHATVLISIHFVLRGDGFDGDAFVSVRLQKLQEVLRVTCEILFPHGAAQHGTVGLHPAGRTPGRRKQKQFRIHLSRLPQRRQEVPTIVLDREAFQVGIGFALVEAIQFSRVVAGADACGRR